MNLIVIPILLGIILFHTVGFWAARRWAASAQSDLSILISGAIAGLTGWFWALFAFGVFAGDSYWTGLVWIYGLPFAPIIGGLATPLFWSFFNRAGIPVSILERIVFGLMGGIAGGGAIGLFLVSLSFIEYGQWLWRGVAVWIFFVAPSTLAAALMAPSNRRADEHV